LLKESIGGENLENKKEVGYIFHVFMGSVRKIQHLNPPVKGRLLLSLLRSKDST